MKITIKYLQSAQAEDFFLPPDVAEFFKVDVKTVYGWCDRGVCYGQKIGGALRIPRYEVLRLSGYST